MMSINYAASAVMDSSVLKVIPVNDIGQDPIKESLVLITCY